MLSSHRSTILRVVGDSRPSMCCALGQHRVEAIAEALREQTIDRRGQRSTPEAEARFGQPRPTTKVAASYAVAVALLSRVDLPVLRPYRRGMDRRRFLLTSLAGALADLAGKRLDLLRELVPTLRRGAVLTYSAHPNTAVRSAESARRHRSPHPGRRVNRLQTFASQSVLAIQNARLFTEKVRQLVAAEEKPLTVCTVAVA